MHRLTDFWLGADGFLVGVCCGAVGFLVGRFVGMVLGFRVVGCFVGRLVGCNVGDPGGTVGRLVGALVPTHVKQNGPGGVAVRTGSLVEGHAVPANMLSTTLNPLAYPLHRHKSFCFRWSHETRSQ